MDTSRNTDTTDYEILVGTPNDGAGTPESSSASARSEESLALLPESTVGCIQVVRLIGCGKVSESWFGVDAKNQREVVVKVLRKPWSSDSTVLSYFESQLNAIRSLDHPNLANVLDVGQDDGMLFWVTEWVKGGSVWPKIRRKGPMEIPAAFNIVDQAAAGLASGAVAGLVHGGLKPENILMERSGAVKVSDLGVEFAARQLVSGTPAASTLWLAEFMAPEVRSGGIPDIRSDIYSLGAILLYLVAGVVPHDGLLDATSPRITPALRQLLIKMTATGPDDRLQDYGELRGCLSDVESAIVNSAATPGDLISATAAPKNETTGVHSGDTQELFETQETLFDSEPGERAVPAAATATRQDADQTTPERELTEADLLRAFANEEDLVYNAPEPAPTPIDLATGDPSHKLVSQTWATPARPAKSRKLAVSAVAVLAVAAAGAAAWFLTQGKPEPKKVVETKAVAPRATTPLSQPTVTAQATPLPSSGSVVTQPAPRTVSTLPDLTAATATPPPIIDPPAIIAPPGVDPVALAQIAATPASPGVAVNFLPHTAPSFSPGAVAAAARTAPAPSNDSIIVDNAVSGALELDPPSGWQASPETRASYAGSSLVAITGGASQKATFTADVPKAGRYQLYMWWVARSSDVRSATVPVTIHTATGPINITVDQVNSDSDFNLIGTYNLKAGVHQPIVSVSTDGIKNPSGNVHVSVDALKLIPKND
ncbi:MAG: protein kinase domain-containing protein [Candidatus Sumerlaeaceae bacterium]